MYIHTHTHHSEYVEVRGQFVFLLLFGSQGSNSGWPGLATCLYLLNHHANIEKILLVISNIAEVNERYTKMSTNLNSVVE